MTANTRTKSEKLFEQFLSDNGLPFTPVPVADSPRPDYCVGEGMEWGPLFFEIKELAKDDNFEKKEFNVSARKIGEHIKSKISESKKQIQFGANQNIPSILLIYNAIDPLHMFGTEEHDFRAAMHGDWTVSINTETGSVVDARYGRNRKFRTNQNTSFTAFGHFFPVSKSMEVRLFPNKHAKVPLPDALPSCFKILE